MRTIRVELESEQGAGMTIRVSTEAIVDDDNAEEAGRDAANAITQFVEGYGHGEMP